MSDIVEVMAKAIADYEGCGAAMCSPPHCHCRNAARAALTALSEGGWVVVPKVPTEAMVRAMIDGGECWDVTDPEAPDGLKAEAVKALWGTGIAASDLSAGQMPEESR